MRGFKDSAGPQKVPFWLNPKVRAILFQFMTFVIVGLLAYYLVSNTLINLKKQNIATGFSFSPQRILF